MENNKAAEGDGGARMSLHSISSLFHKSWEMYKKRCSVLVEILLLPTLVMILGYVLAHLGIALFALLGSLIEFVGYVIFAFSALPVIFSVHNDTGVDASYKATIGWFWPFVWIVILQILVGLGGFLMLIVPGIWLSVALSFTSYLFVIEHRRGIDALRQSKDYIKGYWWAVLGRIILLGLIFIVVSFVVNAVVGIFAGKLVEQIVSMVLSLFFTPLSVIYTYNIFENLRTLKPELGDRKTKEGTGFLKASAIVGLVAPILLIVSVILLIGLGAVQGRMRAESRMVPTTPDYGVNP